MSSLKLSKADIAMLISSTDRALETAYNSVLPVWAWRVLMHSPHNSAITLSLMV